MEQAVPILFYCLAVVTIAGGIAVLVSKKPAHAAVSLLTVFVGVAALVLLRHAVALALLQVVIGGGVVLLCVAVGKRSPTGVSSFVHGFAPLAVVAGVLFGVVAAMGLIFGVPAPGQGDGTALLSVNGEPASNVAAVGAELFTTFLVPLTVVSLMLLVAFVGARRMVRGPVADRVEEGEAEA